LDIARTARALNVTCSIPEGFPHNTLAAARGFYWLADQDDKTARTFARSFYQAYFGEGNDVSPADATADIAAGVGVDRTTFLAAVQDPAIKERLKEETAAALDRGVFGSPFFFVGEEPFWGSDRFDQMARWLETGGW
jgi:2-hydroxychromene-2-carboxylate isomerase